jgi:hypothetical protein
MNWRVVLSLVLAVFWLALGLYFLLSPSAQAGLLDTKTLGWLALLLMVWNLARALMVWQSRRPREEEPRWR